ncbi:MAG: HAMP domain-containing protein [Treponema sp.]|nr:HAMP domain-containing protein [Treponema sp.]
MSEKKNKRNRNQKTKKRRVLFPIGLKLGTIFSILVIFVLGLTIFMVSTLVRDDERLKSEETNHTINSRTAETVQMFILNVQANANGFLNALQLVKNDSAYDEKVQALFTDFCQRNKDTLFIYSSELGLLIQPDFAKQYTKTEEKFMSWLSVNSQYKDAAMKGGVEIHNISPFFTQPVLCISFSRQNDIEASDKDESSLSKEFVTIAFSPDSISSILSTGSYNMSFLLNKDGDVLLHPENSLVMRAENLSYLPAFPEVKKSKLDNGQLLLPDDKGIVWFYAFHKIIGDMYTITCVAQKDVFEAIKHTTIRIIFISIAVLFLAILIIRFFSKSLTHPIEDLADATDRINKGLFKLHLRPKTHDEIGFLTESFIKMAGGLEQRQRLMTSFSKFTNKVIAEKAAMGELPLGGEYKYATVFFSDIRSFTAMSENMTPHDVVEFLNDYFTRMVNCVNKTNGIVDKFVGDAVMAVWGAATTNGSWADDAWSAVKAALMMRIALYEFNQHQKAIGGHPIKIGCGINSGMIVAGQIGSEDHVNYTVIGDAVNLASRTEALNKPFATDILITENTYELIKDKVIVEAMPGVHVKGKSEPIKMYAVINAKGAKGPTDIHKLRKFLGWDEPDLGKVNTDEEEKKYKIEG